MMTPYPEFPEQMRAAQILNLYGRSSNDYFKLWPDKDYWFSASETSLVAYGVSHRVAMTLGDPVAPVGGMEQTIRSFGEYCHQRHWTPLFYQVGPAFIANYERLGYRHFKGSEEAIVDLGTFSIAGKSGRQFRQVLSKMAREDITVSLHDTPVPDFIIEQARIVSDSWLQLGRRERTFTLGRFTEEYVRHTPMMAVQDATGKMLAFANIIPSYAEDTATVDMMRHREDAPHGVMDFLFLKLFDHNRTLGFRYFSLGPAPILAPNPGEQTSLEEKAFFQLTHYLDQFFSMSGLRHYKEKFATIWEPRYLVYKHRRDMPRFVQVINALCELDENKKPLVSRARARQAAKISLALVREIRQLRLARKPEQPSPEANENHHETGRRLNDDADH